MGAVNEQAGQRMIKTNGVNLCTQAFGDPVDPALLLIMGANASMVRWPETLCRQLADSGLHVIRRRTSRLRLAIQAQRCALDPM